MAKRARASRSAHRPGGQGPTRTKQTVDPSSPAVDDTPGGVADAAYDLTGEAIEAQYEEVPLGGTAVAAPPRRTRQDRRRAKSRPDDLAARASAEDVWVREDLRRIGIVSVILVAGLAIAWVLFVPLDLLGLY